MARLFFLLLGIFIGFFLYLVLETYFEDTDGYENEYVLTSSELRDKYQLYQTKIH